MSESEKTVEVLSAINLNEEQIARLKEVSKAISLTVYSSRDFANIPAEVWERTEVLMTSGRNIPQPEQAPNLRWIQLTMAGVEAALKQEIVQKPDLQLSSASGTMVPQMGEYILMAFLALGHRVPEFIQNKGHRKWGSNLNRNNLPLEMRNSTVGIVGYGSIGREAARLVKGLGAKVLAVKRDAMHPEDTGYTPAGHGDPQGDYFDRLYPIEGMKSMLAECDFVLISLPETPATHELFNAEMISAMKPGTLLVNVSRGGLFHEPSLLAAMKSGHIAAAVLDVFQQEPLPEDSPFWKLPNLIITPHISGFSANAVNDLTMLFAENLRRYLDGSPLLNLVDREKGY